jgi:5-methylcytosine-specific restriction endonuclease McrA
MGKAGDPRNRYRWKHLSHAVIQRDGGICWICGGYGADSADHMVPLRLGGRDSPDNLRAAHMRCNARRGGGQLHWHPRPQFVNKGLGTTSRQW